MPKSESDQRVPSMSPESGAPEQLGDGQMYEHFNRAKWLNVIGQSGASVLMVALCWPLASQAGLTVFLGIHQSLLLLVIAIFASPLGHRWKAINGLPLFTAPALAVTQTVGGSVMWFDLHGAQDLTFALATFAVIYASAAFSMVTLGPVKDLARLVLFASLLPSTVAALYVGHYLLGLGSLVFLGVVGIFGVSQIHRAYSRLMNLQSQSARDAQTARAMARRDPLTGLLNRIGVSEQFTAHQQEIRSAFFIDLDRFKKVNDDAGHLAGDDLLRKVSKRLGRVAPVGTIVSRVGGDEFLLLMTTEDVDQLHDLGHKIITMLEEPFVLSVGTYSVSASIGICLIQNEASLERVFHEADNAMYRAKRNGRGRVMVFTEDMDAELRERAALEKELYWLIDRGEFLVHGQPIFDLATGEVRAIEVLARPRFRSGKRYSPAEFLPILEELQLLDIMTGIVLLQAVQARAEWREIESMKNTAVSINIPAKSLTSDWLVHEVRNLTSEYDLVPGDLIFEITEKALTSDIESSRETLSALCEMGVEIALDDFGIGYSSLNQLLLSPLSTVKIDGSIVQHIEHVEQGGKFMTAIIEVVRSFGHQVIAEGIETQSQLDAAFSAGATLGQGFLLSRPKPLDVLIATLSAHPRKGYSTKPAPNPLASPSVPRPTKPAPIR